MAEAHSMPYAQAGMTSAVQFRPQQSPAQMTPQTGIPQVMRPGQMYGVPAGLPPGMEGQWIQQQIAAGNYRTAGQETGMGPPGQAGGYVMRSFPQGWNPAQAIAGPGQPNHGGMMPQFAPNQPTQGNAVLNVAPSMQGQQPVLRAVGNQPMSYSVQGHPGNPSQIMVSHPGSTGPLQLGPAGQNDSRRVESAPPQPIPPSNQSSGPNPQHPNQPTGYPQIQGTPRSMAGHSMNQADFQANQPVNQQSSASTPRPDPQPVARTPAPSQPGGGNWDGEVMLHLYIHDYLMKRQFFEAASALRNEAGLGEQLVVPIDCRQGLLYEWWAVFWDVFSTGNGKPQPSPEAIQFMNAQLRQRLAQHQQMGLPQGITPQMAAQQNALRPGQQGAVDASALARQQLMQKQMQQQNQQQQQQQLQHQQPVNHAPGNLVRAEGQPQSANADNAPTPGMRSVTPQISVQMANSSPYQAGNATNAQRAHLAAQAAHAHQQHLQGQMIQQVRPPPTQAQAAAQSHATMFQTVASDLGIANCHPQVLNNALWATGLANRHPESWNDAEKSRVLGSYNVLIDQMRKEEGQKMQRVFGDPNGLGFPRPQSIVPASPSVSSQMNVNSVPNRMNGVPQMTSQQHQMYLQQMSQNTRPAEEESGDSPPNKRPRRNSGSAAASPFSLVGETPQNHATPHPQQTPVSATMSLNHQMAMQAQAQQLSASQAQAQAQAAYMQNIQQQQQTQHQQQQQILQRQQMMQQLQGGGPSPSDVRAYQQRIAEQQRQSMRAVAANSQGPSQPYNQANSPLPQASETEGKGGPATPAFEAHVNNTPGANQLSLHTLQRAHSSKSVSRLASNAQHSPSVIEFATPPTGATEQTGPAANGETNPTSPKQATGPVNRGNEREPTPVGAASDQTAGTGTVNRPAVDTTESTRPSMALPAPSTPKTGGQALPSPPEVQQGDASRPSEQPSDPNASHSSAAQSSSQPDPAPNQMPPANQDQGDGGVDFSHLLGNDLFNSMNGAEDGAEYDINFANFGMDGDIFEIYMNDGYEGGAQAGDGT